MLSLDFIADSLDIDGNSFDTNNIDKYDLNSDGVIDINDCPFIHGSSEAKLWWHNILKPSIKSGITPELDTQYGDSIVGVYKGKPIVPGSDTAGQGDFQLLVDKIRIIHGLDYASSVKIAGKVKFLKYGI